MYEKTEPLQFSAVFANVQDLDAVLAELYSQFTLTPFLRFDLEESGETTPIALVRIGDQMLELLGRVEGNRPESGAIHAVEIEAPVSEKVEHELAPGMKIVAFPGDTPHIKAVEILTSLPKEDAAALIDYTGATRAEPTQPLELSGTAIRLKDVAGLPDQATPGLFFPGWHRFSVSVNSVTESYDFMAASDSSLQKIVEPFQVMPGLKEAMLALPSHVILQITEQSRVKMTPAIALEWLKAKFARQHIHFTSKKI